MKVVSNVGAAKDAVSGFAGITADGKGQQASLGSSNVASMQAGVMVADQILASLGELASGVKKQAENVTALALEIEERDRRDVSGWCEAR